MKNFITKFMVFMGVLSLYALITTGPAHADVNVPPKATIVEVVEQTAKGFTTSFLTFKDQHTAEEFADAINAAPVVKYNPSWKVWRRAIVYAK